MAFFKRHKNYLLVIFISAFMGLLGGTIGAAFYHTLHFVTDLRGKHPWLLYFLVLGGFLTVLIYKLLKVENQDISNVFSSVKMGDKVSPLLFPAVFLGTTITQLFGGSAGKEGAALQIGGSISVFLLKKFGITGKNAKAVILCGLAAVFSAVFATPLTAVAFALEIVFISRRFYFKAILPVSLSSVLAFKAARFLGVSSARIYIGKAPALTVGNALKGLAVILVCVGGCLLFCLTLHTFDDLFKRFFKNAYLRVAVGGVLIIGLTMLVGNYDYNGGGMDIIKEVLKTGRAVWFAFLLKILFTAVTNAAGYKGGEIVPALFIGATLGALAGGLIGFNPVFAAAVGMITLFGGATKCTVAAFMLSLEFFGLSGALYFALAALISRVLTFNIGLYTHNKKA